MESHQATYARLMDDDSIKHESRELFHRLIEDGDADSRDRLFANLLPVIKRNAWKLIQSQKLNNYKRRKKENGRFVGDTMYDTYAGELVSEAELNALTWLNEFTTAKAETKRSQAIADGRLAEWKAKQYEIDDVRGYVAGVVKSGLIRYVEEDRCIVASYESVYKARKTPRSCGNPDCTSVPTMADYECDCKRPLDCKVRPDIQTLYRRVDGECCLLHDPMTGTECGSQTDLVDELMVCCESDREKQFFRLAIQGVSTTEICNQLKVSESTLCRIRGRILERYDARRLAMIDPHCSTVPSCLPRARTQAENPHDEQFHLAT